MHTTRNKLILVGAALAAGFSSLGLHRYMMANYIDAKGLLIAGNLPGRLLMLVGVGFTLTLLLMLWKLGGDGSYADIFPRDPVSGLLMIAAGITLTLSMPGLHWSSLPSAAPVTPLVSFWEKFFTGCMTAMPWLAAVSMVTLGLCRILGRKGWFSFGGVICLFYILTLVSNCRLWSADPQLQDYAFQMLACVALMLAGYYRAAADAGIIRRRMLAFSCFAACFLCVVSLSDPQTPVYYGACGLWALSSAGFLEPVHSA